ncbi:MULTISPECIES: MraY family glycosyltransferase [Acidiphilium]|jgi:UDP-GlcNAc:undecaprenyl-phosphate GlcNAc-1-phosphate transferase|uniref:Glycosyl transferase, family 4 n=2 Tax=Acidiphilium TaxID=522 RepID=A5G177_ACICJ|nr:MULTISPECIES: MraY family glycosyltransferase [Acidiphilium]MBU6356683.1 undecaprenyl/decaprenyl-phosphate alpha-N-acetylglucosaminyl 1-phosphate transferase [Rhodospirillales bacterium]ABQ31609.1 glycosyl transferase, family 4 [Acidiphilium cryptum JF-5]EGO95793.1 Glycosyl transferase family protein [Acidiphilium sp. PM]KDM65993.1 glycosyl transferase family protein [Acidiphilium sp. JA12-A1]MBS3024807.1 undecaprenyl/decaprenyl-phosphate alpha-N-acetylglucosaminyl 1-phosphate transferase [
MNTVPYFAHPGIATLALPRHLALFAGLALFSGFVVRLMIAIGVPDRPDARKAHTRVMPKSGGVGIVGAFMLGILLLYRYGHVSRLAAPVFLGVIAAAALIAAVSLLDDLKDFPFAVKLGAQCVAAVVAVGSGISAVRFDLPLIGGVALGAAGPVLSVGWILFVTNAMNFIDGLDGLAAGTTLVTCLFLAGIAGLHGGFFVYTTALLLAGGVAGFLPFNWPRARIFMGDVGSQFCGFMLAVLGLAATHYQHVPLSFLVVPLLLSGVLLDVSFTLARRALAGRNLARAHRGHLYQVAHRAGVDPRIVAVVYWGFAAFGGVVVIGFLNAATAWKPLVVFAPLLPFALWAGFVIRRARAVNLGDWG